MGAQRARGFSHETIAHHLEHLRHLAELELPLQRMEDVLKHPQKAPQTILNTSPPVRLHMEVLQGVLIACGGLGMFVDVLGALWG